MTNRRYTHSTQITHLSPNATQLPPRELLTAFTCVGPTSTPTTTQHMSNTVKYKSNTSPAQVQYKTTTNPTQIYFSSPHFSHPATKPNSPAVPWLRRVLAPAAVHHLQRRHRGGPAAGAAKGAHVPPVARACALPVRPAKQSDRGRRPLVPNMTALA